jgi:hypothetical protein
MPIILPTGEAEIKIITVQSHPCKYFARSYLENTQKKKGLVSDSSGRAPALAIKAEALISNSTTAKK